MKAQFVFEKFSDEGDSIIDMGIGVKGIWNNLSPKMVFKLKKNIPSLGARYKKGLIVEITDVKERPETGQKVIIYNEFCNKRDYVNNITKHVPNPWWWDYDFFKEYFAKYFEFIDLKESVNEKFEEVSDPIHDMSIGDPLMRAGGKLQQYAEEHGYEFRLEKIAKTESPVMYVPIEQVFEIRSGFQGGGATCAIKLKYTITYIPRQSKPLSLRKVFMGYVYVPTDEDYDFAAGVEYLDGKGYKNWEKWQMDKLKQEMKGGGMKEKPLKQALLKRFSEKDIDEIIKRIDKNIKNATKK